MAEENIEEIWKTKINNALKRLETSKNVEEKEKQEHAIRLAEIFKDKDDKSKMLKEEYYLKYRIAKTKANTFALAISQFNACIKYG